MPAGLAGEEAKPGDVVTCGSRLDVESPPDQELLSVSSLSELIEGYQAQQGMKRELHTVTSPTVKGGEGGKK